MPPNDHLHAEVEGMVEENAQLMTPICMAPKGVKIVNHQAGGSRKRFAP